MKLRFSLCTLSLLLLALGCGPSNSNTEPPVASAGGGDVGKLQGGGGEGTTPPAGGASEQPAPAAGGNTAAGGAVTLRRLIPREVFAAIVARPAQALAAPVLKPLPLGELLETMQDRAPFELSDVEQVTLIAIPPSPGDSESDVVAVTFQFIGPANRQGMLQSLFGDDPPEEVSVGQATYLTNGFGAVHFFNETTVLMGGAPAVEAVLKGTEPNAELLSRLERLGGERELVVAVQMGPVFEFLRQAEAQGAELPPAAAALPALAAEVRLASAAFDLRGGRLLELHLESGDAESQAALEHKLSEQLAEAKQQYAAAREGISRELGLLAAPLLQMADTLLEGLSVEGTPDHTRVTLARPADLEAFAEAMAPALQQGLRDARRAAGRTGRMNDLKQVGLGMLVYESAHGQLPASSVDAEGRPLLSWRVHILPFLEHQALYQQFKLDEPWDSPHNLALLDRMPSFYGGEGNKTRYQLFVGEGMPLNPGSRTGVRHFRDGMSNTLLLAESAPEKAVEWTRPDDLPFNPENPLAPLGLRSAEPFLVLFADGSVRQLDPAMNREVFKALLTHDAGDGALP